LLPSVFLTVFERATVAESLDAAQAAGFTSVHFDLSLLTGVTLPREIPVEQVRNAHAEVLTRGMTLASTEATYNMAHPDPAVRRRGRPALAALIEIAPTLGSQVLSLCTGSRGDGMWVGHVDNATQAAWADMLAEVSAAVDVAERHGVVLGIECEQSNVVSSAELGRQLLDELRSPALKIVLDAANLIPPGHHAHQERILRSAFELLGEDIVVAHAKDILPDGTFVAAGHGVLDYPLFLALLREHGFDGPLILHSLHEDEVPASLAFVQAASPSVLR